VTHDQIEAMTLADRIAIMKDGIVQQLDTPQMVYENPVNKFVAGFIGSPSMNFIPCKVDRNAGQPALVLKTPGDKTYLLPIRRWAKALGDRIGDEVILGLRPEHISNAFTSEQAEEEMQTIESQVQVVEPTGPDTLVFITLNNREVTCRVHPSEARNPGEMMPLMMDMTNAILFDPQTEERLD
jgi:multiple sugar transport system ATP-binding protein